MKIEINWNEQSEIGQALHRIAAMQGISVEAAAEGLLCFQIMSFGGSIVNPLPPLPWRTFLAHNLLVVELRVRREGEL